MTTRILSEDVRTYLRLVRERLDDLPAQEREDLLADVEPSVLDSAGESDAPVALRLGPPERFADDLRAAAGLPPRAGSPAAQRSLRSRLAVVTGDPRLRAAAPLWWVTAGYAGVAVAASPGGGRWAALAMALTVGTLALAGLATFLGRRWRAVAVVLALGLLLVIAGVSNRAPTVVEVAPVAPATGLVWDGLPLDNLYAFDRRGRLLYDVRLYAGTGQPLEIGRETPDPHRRVPRTRSGERVFNAFPIRYFEPGTRRVANPAAGAPLAPAPLKTKPLK